MNVWGGYAPSVNSIGGSSYKADPVGYSSPALQTSAGISVSASADDAYAKGGSTKEQAAAPSTGSSAAEPASTVDIALPRFDDSGNAHLEDYKVSTEGAEPVQEKHLDLSKLDLTPTVTHVYQHEDGSVGWEPDNKGTIDGTLTSSKKSTKTPTQKMEEAARSMDNVYRPMGDDYDIDVDAAFAAAQRGTGEDQAAMSVSGGGGDSENRSNSNVNDAVFGGQSDRATPGYSLW